MGGPGVKDLQGHSSVFSVLIVVTANTEEAAIFARSSPINNQISPEMCVREREPSLNPTA